MKTGRATTLGLIAALVVGTPRADGLDFVLQAASVEEDGFTREQLYVRNDERTNVLLTLPARWARNDGAASLTVIPPDIRNSLVRVEKSSLAPGIPWRDKGVDTYRRRAEADVPQGAVGLQCKEEHDEPLPIFGWKSHEFVFTYEFFGQSYRRSVVFVNLNAREQIVLTSVAPGERFDEVRAAGFDLLRSWQVVAAR